MTNIETSPEARPVALITGGTTGIGRATALELRTRGYAVVVTGNSTDTLTAARAELPEGITVVQADVSKIRDADRVAEKIRARHHHLDAVFLNAGTGPMQAIDQVDEATFDKTFDTNIKGNYFTLQKVLPLVRDGGSIVVMTAQGVRIGATNYSAATASRGAMMALVAPLAVELGPRRIRVNAISPAAIDTAAFDKLGLPAEARAAFDEWILGRVPLGRIGRADEVAKAVAFLLTEDSSYVNGVILAVDGGMGIS